MSFSRDCLVHVLDEKAPPIVRRELAHALDRVFARLAPDERTLTDMIRALDALGPHPDLAWAVAGAVASGTAAGPSLYRAFERALARGHVATAGVILERMLSRKSSSPHVEEDAVASAVADLSVREDTIAIAGGLLNRWIENTRVVPPWAEAVVERTPDLFETLSWESALLVHRRVPTLEGWRVVGWYGCDLEVQFSAVDFGEREPRARASLDAALGVLDANVPGAVREVLTRWRDGWFERTARGDGVPATVGLSPGAVDADDV